MFPVWRLPFEKKSLLKVRARRHKSSKLSTKFREISSSLEEFRNSVKCDSLLKSIFIDETIFLTSTAHFWFERSKEFLSNKKNFKKHQQKVSKNHFGFWNCWNYRLLLKNLKESFSANICSTFESLQFSLHEECPYSEFFWSVFFRIRTKYG